MRYLRIIAMFLFAAIPAGAATNFYIDYTNGLDSNNGTSKSTPWKHAPGMTGCSSNCAAYTSTGGNSWVLKGCVTWPAAALPWVPVYSSQTSAENAGGLDQTWWDNTVTGCSTAWNRPIINAGGVLTGSTDVVVDFHNFAFGLQYVEFTGGYFDATHTLTYLLTAEGQTLAVSYDHLYLHGWTWTGTNDYCQLILGDSHIPNTSPLASLTNSVIDGTDSVVSGKTACYTVYGGPPIEQHNVIKNTSNGLVLNGPSDVDNNFISNIGPSLEDTNCSMPAYHGNGFEDNGSEGLIVYNNVIQHLAQCGVLNLWFAPVQGYTVWAWNNVSWDLDSSNSTNIIDLANSVSSVTGGCPGGVTGGLCTYSGTFYLYNNTVECGSDSAPTNDCAQGNVNATAMTLVNNHFITSFPGGSSCITGGGNCTGTATVVQTKLVANGQFYSGSTTYAFSPQNSSGSTITTAGTNLTSSATGALASLANDTPYGCTEVSTPYVTVSCPTRTANARPSLGNWQVGAYQFGSTAVTPPAPCGACFTDVPNPPTNLKVTAIPIPSSSNRSVDGSGVLIGGSAKDDARNASPWPQLYAHVTGEKSDAQIPVQEYALAKSSGASLYGPLSQDRFKISMAAPDAPSSKYGYWSIFPPTKTNWSGPSSESSMLEMAPESASTPPLQLKSNDRSIVSVTFAPVSVIVPLNGYSVSALAESVAKNRIAASSEAFIP